MNAPALLAASVLMLAGCSCAASHALDGGTMPDIGADAPIDVDAHVASADASSPWLDGAAGDLLCGAAGATTCPTQDAASAHPCGSTGRVVFDGERCQLASGASCDGEPGAFDSFVECAFACEPTHCYVEAMGAPPWISEPLAECPSRDDLAACWGLYADTDVLLESCAAFGPMGCGVDPGSPPFRCRYFELSEMADTPARIRAMTLLPFVHMVYCDAPGP